MAEELYSNNTRFCKNMNKEPKRKIFVDVALGGLNHDIYVFYVTVFVFMISFTLISFYDEYVA
jgi:hypothetical protein